MHVHSLPSPSDCHEKSHKSHHGRLIHFFQWSRHVSRWNGSRRDSRPLLPRPSHYPLSSVQVLRRRST